MGYTTLIVVCNQLYGVVVVYYNMGIGILQQVPKGEIIVCRTCMKFVRIFPYKLITGYYTDQNINYSLWTIH